ncbi:MAG: hypothetical protein HRT90_09235 [Candidatus Margulisbacteria bacterium]|nr:hypothetical protein [Candidatus Margulisiibacteriota bacterium]
MVKLIFAIIVVVGINFSRDKLSKRFSVVSDDYSRMSFLIEDNQDEIMELNISDNSKFIVAPDLCQNGGLFSIDKMGWNIEKQKDISTSKINHYKYQGAEYLILTSTDQELLDIGNTTGKIILEGKGINIFKLNTANNTKKMH